MNFNKKIDDFMEKKGFKNLKQFAIACDIPYTTLRDFYEKKSADNSRLSTIRKLSKFMKCTMDYLAYDDVLHPNETKDININDDNIHKKIDTGNGVQIIINKNKNLTPQDVVDVNKELMNELEKK